jgi:hypothetical protein
LFLILLLWTNWKFSIFLLCCEQINSVKLLISIYISLIISQIHKFELEQYLHFLASPKIFLTNFYFLLKAILNVERCLSIRFKINDHILNFSIWNVKLTSWNVLKSGNSLKFYLFLIHKYLIVLFWIAFRSHSVSTID